MQEQQELYVAKEAVKRLSRYHSLQQQAYELDQDDAAPSKMLEDTLVIIRYLDKIHRAASTVYQAEVNGEAQVWASG